MTEQNLEREFEEEILKKSEEAFWNQDPPLQISNAFGFKKGYFAAYHSRDKEVEDMRNELLWAAKFITMNGTEELSDYTRAKGIIKQFSLDDKGGKG